jgi:signal transduction histidine kinase
MAQDAVSPRVRAPGLFGWVRTAALWLYHLLPKSPALPPVAYNPALVIYVTATAAAAVAVSAVVIIFRADIHPAVLLEPWTLAIGGLTIFLMSVYAIRTTGPAAIQWAPTVFIHLGLAVTFGPAGAAVGGFAEPLGVTVRNHNGWFRTIYNVSNNFLADSAAWAVFALINGPVVHGTWTPLGAGLAAGFVHFTLNSGFVAVVIHLSDRRVKIREVMRSRLTALTYSIGYGFAAFAFVVVTQKATTVGFMAMLAPVIMLHGYLISYTRSLKAHEEERAAFELEEKRLILKSVAASEAERMRIARDLHDGVVQNLAGMAMTLSAEASQLKGQRTSVDGQRAELLELLESSATEARGAMKDLRTLIVDLAPPTFRREGLEGALLEVLREMKRKGTNTELDLPPNLRLREDRGKLIFRVAQEILRNVAAHAAAKNVKVELSTDENSAILSIEDDGKGFSEEDLNRRRAEGHLGTVTIVELAEDAGGTLTIDSEPGRGTLVVLTLPIE